jgi:FdhD protein
MTQAPPSPDTKPSRRHAAPTKATADELAGYLLRPAVDDAGQDTGGLADLDQGLDESGQPQTLAVIKERALTLYLNSQEIVTMMTIGDHPKDLARGYLLNQNMLGTGDVITDIDYDDDLEVVVVRTRDEVNYLDKLKKKTLTSGCAQGTAFGDMMERFDRIKLDRDVRLCTSELAPLLSLINRTPSLYLAAGAIHGCVLAEGARPLVYMEDVGRHNAVDKIAGFAHRQGLNLRNKIFFTTGRLTSEMVIKTVQMEIPILVSRSGFTQWGVELARQAGLTLIGRAKGRRFTLMAGAERVIFDSQAGDLGD